MILKKIVCLANSKKHSGRCVAGKDISDAEFGRWIRPISARPTAEISEDERQYENGDDPKVLDIIRIPVIGPVPHMCQTENYMIDANCYWEKEGELAWRDLKQFLDHPASIWTNDDSSYYGVNDRIKVTEARFLTSSLYLLEPEGLLLEVLVEGAEFGKPRTRVRADFSYNGVRYRFSLTDPATEKTVRARGAGRYTIRNAYLCVSLGEPFQDEYCYKLVAAVIAQEPI